MKSLALEINHPEYISRRRRLRRDQTMAEKVLWRELRNRKFQYKFRRQTSVGNFIPDFYCHDLLLVIELDGPVHDDPEQKIKDEKKERWLTTHGCKVLRFKNDEVLFTREKVMEKILQVCQERKKNVSLS